MSFDTRAMVGVLVQSFFMEDGGKNTSFLCCESVSVCVTSKLFSVLSVGQCLRHKNQFSTYCAILSEVLAVELQ